MTKAMRWGALAGGLLVALAVPAAAQQSEEPAQEAEEKSWSLEVGLDYSSLYMYRGLNLLGEDQAVWTPRAALAFGDWSVWFYGYSGKFDAFDDEGNQLADGTYTEADLGIDYTFAIGEKLGLTVGALTYQYSGEVERGLGYLDTFEVYAIASWDTVVVPTISFYYDVDAIEAGFLTLDLAHDFALSDRVGLTLSGQLGFDFGYNQPGDPDAGIEQSAGNLHHFMLGLDLPWQVSDAFAVHLLVQRSFSLAVADELGQPDETIVTGGLSYTF